MNYYYGVFAIFSITLFLIIEDQNVAKFIVLLFNLFKINVQRFFWMIRLHPIWVMNPIGKWLLLRKNMKMVKDILDEQSQKDD